MTHVSGQVSARGQVPQRRPRTDACSRDADKGPVINYGEWGGGGVQNGRGRGGGGAVKIHPYGNGGGGQKMFYNLSEQPPHSEQLRLETGLEVLAILKGGGGDTRFPPSKSGAWKDLPCLEGGGSTTSFGPVILPFCSPHPLPVVNDMSLRFCHLGPVRPIAFEF